ncbi:hypothetical protein RYX36_029696, partial [Vicia faba]
VPPFIPDEIVAEILCLLPVKTILQLRCVSKAWKTLISDPTFIQKHFNNSSQNPHLLFTPLKLRYPMSSVQYSPVLRLLDNPYNPSLIVSRDNFHVWKNICQVVGTCKGLLCLFFHYRYQNYWFCLWNPATRTLSEILGISQDHETLYDSFKFTFGCDISTGTYKVVALSEVAVREENNTLSMRNQFRVLSFGDNCWRTFQYGSSIPVCMIYTEPKRINNGVHLNGTVNWLALPKYIKPSDKYDWKSIANAQQFVIVSLDLSTETCTQLLLPSGFDELPFIQPNLYNNRVYSSHKLQMNMDSNAPQAPSFIPDEIVAEILCLLPVKTILQLRCVSKAWKTLISDPTFIQKHFNNSSQNPHLLFTPLKLRYPMSSVEYFPVLRLLDNLYNLSLIVSRDNFHGWKNICQVVGTCKGLLCLFFHYRYQNYWFCLWNPATRTLSEKLGISQDHETLYDSFKFTFGCDISTGTYKVVALSEVAVREENNTLSMRNQFRVLSFGDNCWRTFQYGSSIPVCMVYTEPKRINNGVHLNGTVNWLALPKYIKPSDKYDWKSIDNAQQFVIVSVDLSTETCTQLLLPSGFDELPFIQPNVNVLMDCLCFSHDLKGSEFVIWQMKKFGVQKSWTLLFKINYFDHHLLPLYLSKNGDTCILANYEDNQVVIYNQRENKVKIIGIANKLRCFSGTEYVESLVSTC